MTDDYRLFVRDYAIEAEQALYNLGNALNGISGKPYSINEWEGWALTVEHFRIRVAGLTYLLEHPEEDA